MAGDDSRAGSREVEFAHARDLVARIQELGERYDETVGDLDAEAEKLESEGG